MQTDPGLPSSDGHALEYCGFRFQLRAEPVPGGFQSMVLLVRTPADEDAPLAERLGVLAPSASISEELMAFAQAVATMSREDADLGVTP